MDAHELPADTHIGFAHLRVADLPRSLVLYRDLLGFRVTGQQAATATLTAAEDGLPALILTAVPGARPRPPRTTGLFHVAIRLKNRQALGQVLWRLAAGRWRLQGAADHGVSEALYLADPDGNGLELYIDRPRDVWRWDGDQVAMVTAPLDLDALLDEADPQAAASHPLDADIGHMHLQVASLARAERFYRGVLGFRVMQRSYPGALFVAAGGYHHHLGLNTWAGPDASPPPPDAAGLIAFALALPDPAALDQAVRRLHGAGIDTAPDDGDPAAVLTHDPDGNRVVLRADRP